MFLVKPEAQCLFCGKFSIKKEDNILQVQLVAQVPILCLTSSPPVVLGVSTNQTIGRHGPLSVLFLNICE